MKNWNSPFGYASDCNLVALPNMVPNEKFITAGSGLDAPLFALQMLMGKKQGLVRYLSLSSMN